MKNQTDFKSRLNGYIPALDGVRGLAILLVLAIHIMAMYRWAFAYQKLYMSGELDNIIFSFFEIGWVGVDIFFVLSGFLITGILIENKERDITAKQYFLNFIARRTLRIFPLYYLSITIFLYVVPAFVGEFEEQYQALVGIPDKWIFFGYLQNFYLTLGGPQDIATSLLGPTWSLAIEEHFYLLWPAFIFLLNKKKIVYFIMLAITLVVALRYSIVKSVSIPIYSMYFWTFCRIDSLLLGSVLAIALRSEKTRSILNTFKWIIAALSLSSLLALVYWTKAYYLHKWNFIGYLIIAFLGASIINLLVNLEEEHSLNKFFSSKLMVLFGKRSYSIYIFHMPIIIVSYVAISMFEISSPITEFIVFIFLCLVSNLTMSWLTWHLYEKHFLRLKEFFNYRKTPEINVQKKLEVQLTE